MTKNEKIAGLLREAATLLEGKGGRSKILHDLRNQRRSYQHYEILRNLADNQLEGEWDLPEDWGFILSRPLSLDRAKKTKGVEKTVIDILTKIHTVKLPRKTRAQEEYDEEYEIPDKVWNLFAKAAEIGKAQLKKHFPEGEPK